MEKLKLNLLQFILIQQQKHDLNCKILFKKFYA